jgi:hypothetical protein
MTPEELVTAAANAILAGTNVTVCLPHGEKFPAGWPRGELLCISTSKHKAYSFDPLKVLAHVQKFAKGHNESLAKRAGAGV